MNSNQSFETKLSSYTNGQLPKLWFLIGSEPLWSIEAQDSLRRAAAKEGFTERKSFVLEATGDYGPFYEALGDLSLFGEKTLLEIAIPKAAIGTKGPAAIEALLNNLDDSKMVVVTLFEYDWQIAKKPWVKALEAKAQVIKNLPISKENLPGWIMMRSEQITGQKFTIEAANFLAEKTEGNLLACNQEIQKISLLCEKNTVEIEDVLESVSDVSRFDIENLISAILEGNPQRIAKIIDSLKAENIMIPSFLWLIVDLVRKLIQTKSGSTTGTRRRDFSIEKCAGSFSLKRFELMLHRLGEVDRLSKGLRAENSDGDAWSELKATCLLLAIKGK